MEDPVEHSEKESITPDLGGIGAKSSDNKPADELKSAENSAAGKASGKDAKSKENAPQSPANKIGGGLGGGLFSGKGKPGKGGKDSKSGMLGKLGLSGGKAMPLLLILVLLLVLIPVLLLGAPMFMIGTIDYNLQDSLGFSDTAAVVEEQGLNITEELAKKGELPDKFAGDLAKSGIIVGQVTASGDFVRTNRYIANLDDDLEIAASGFDYFVNGAEGELAFLFDNQVVNADNFVAAVHSNPQMYAAYSSALDVTARFYYSDEVNDVYQDLGLSRGIFNGWQSTGNHEKDAESFYEILDDALATDISADMAGCSGEGDDGSCDEAQLSTGGDAATIVNEVSNSAGGTHEAAQLLNSAISASEPRQAARAFLALEEPLQRARIDGDGPVNQVMNTLSTPTEITYTDVNTNEEVTVKKSILETNNFVAAVSNGKYSTREANNFSRDNVLIATGTMDNNTISQTTVGESSSSTSAALRRGSGNVEPEIINRATSSVQIATTEFDTDRFSSIVGGNRIIEGGSYLSNTINMRTLGAMPSDAATIAKYQREVDVMVARRNEAERATLSPFDFSSPNTFLGSIVHNFAKTMISHSSSNDDTNIISAISTTTDLASKSLNSLIGNTIAEGNDQKFTTLAGDCSTVKKANNVEGDIYCNPHNTITTKYMNRTKAEWQSVLNEGSNLENEQPAGDLKNFILYGTDRDATPGVQSKEICEAYKQENQGIFGNLADKIAGIFGVYRACRGMDDPEEIAIATGAAYTLSSENRNVSNIENYSGYVLYDTVYALIQDSKSNVSAFKEDYYKKHPKDNSLAGQIARFSGMTKDEAEIALNYASYLTFIANYDASERYAFGLQVLQANRPISIVKDEKIKENAYCYWCGKMELAELRDQNFVA